MYRSLFIITVIVLVLAVAIGNQVPGKPSVKLYQPKVVLSPPPRLLKSRFRTRVHID